MTPQPRPEPWALPQPLGGGGRGGAGRVPTEVLPLETFGHSKHNNCGNPVSPDPDSETYSQKLRDDHAYVTLFCTDCGTTRQVPIYCKDRFCPVCSVTRRNRLRERMQFLIANTPFRHPLSLKMITLTQPNSTDAKAGVKSIIDQFHSLRRKANWRRLVVAGCFTVEVTRGTAGYHCHIHALVISRYYPRQQLSEDWAASGIGKITHIEFVGPERGVNYITKYITKPSVPGEFLDDVSAALKSVRMFNVFGKWHRMKLPKIKHLCHCRNCTGSSWARMGSFMAGGYALDESYANYLWDAWRRRHPPPTPD